MPLAWLIQKKGGKLGFLAGLFFARRCRHRRRRRRRVSTLENLVLNLASERTSKISKNSLSDKLMDFLTHAKSRQLLARRNYRLEPVSSWQAS